VTTTTYNTRTYWTDIRGCSGTNSLGPTSKPQPCTSIRTGSPSLGTRLTQPRAVITAKSTSSWVHCMSTTQYDLYKCAHNRFNDLTQCMHSPTHSFPDIMRRSAFTRTAMQSLDKQLWQSRISLSTKLRLYNTCILPIFLYGSECWAITKEDAHRINALHQWCLHMLLGIKWYHFIFNNEVRRQTNQPLLKEIIQARHLTLFGHIAQMDDNVDAKQILTSSPSVYWKRPPG